MSELSSSEVPRKRSRTDVATPSSDEHAYAVAQQDDDFWMKDGTVVLIVGHIKFRVYRGLLEEHSSVFTEMSSLPQPAGTTPQACPIITLHDNPDDWRHLLRLLLPRKRSRYG